MTISYRAWATEIGQLTEESYNRMMNIFCSFWCRCDTPFIPAYFVREVYDNIYKSVYPDDSDRQGQHDPRRHRNVYERREGEDGRLPPARRIERTINRDPEDRNWRERVRERVAQQAAEGDTNTGPALYGPGGYQRETQERARQGTDGGATETVARQPAPPTEPTPVRQPVPPGPNAGRGIRRDEPTPAPRPRPQRTQQGPESAASRNPFDALTTDEGEEEEDEDGEEETEHARQTGPPRGPAPSQGLPGGDPNFDLPGTASDPTSNDPFTEPHRSSLSDTGDSGPPLPETHEVLDYDAVGGADTRNFGKLAGRLGLDQIHWSKDPIHDIDPLAGRRSFLTHPPTATEKMAYSVPHVTIQKLIDYDSREYWRRGYNITEDLDEEQTVTVLNYIDNQREFNQMQLNLHHQRAKLFRPGLVKWTKDILKGNKLWPVTEEELSTATEYAGDVQDTPVLIGYMQSFSEDMYDVYDEYFEPSDSDDSDRSDGGTTRPPRQMLQSFMFEQGRRDPAAVTPSRYKTPPAPIPERSTVEDDGKSPSSVAVTDQTSAEPSPPRRSLEEELAMGTEGFDSQSSNENGAQSGAEAEEEK